ncbi:MAG TPA: M1 family aminopeptidase [Polyangia bacterium]|nr:M1 family aminopeptidase [Polyangia bacterium]
MRRAQGPHANEDPGPGPAQAERGARRVWNRDLGGAARAEPHGWRLTKRAILGFACLIACSSTRTSAGAGTSTGSGTGAPRLRLPDQARPTRYAAELTVLPDQTSFRGQIDIDLTLRAATPLLWLNASQLQVSEARLEPTGDAAGPARAARVVPGGEDFVGFAFDPPAGPGPARLHVVYSGRISRQESRGVFAEKAGDDWYAFTQFEATDARRAFPCFDEPSYKAPWQLSLRVREQMVAVANTPQAGESPDPEPGWKRVRFAETKPLPSYLVAFAVGPFDVVPAPASSKRVPMRVVTPRGRGAEARYILKTAPVALSLLEDYFGIPYPFEKLDLVAVPLTVQFGAMENPGLVTYAESAILARPLDETLVFQRRATEYTIHEFAHQWFGDLVTTAWWDDIWLNESFADWITSKIVERWQPEWDSEVERVESRSGVMAEDGLVSARKIRQPILSNDDIANAFDNITYAKGEAVLEMFESWIGETRFRDGVRRYLRKHAFANATATDFLAALAAAGGANVAPAFSSFLDQSGAPLLTVELRCQAGRPPSLLLQQERYLPLGSQGQAAQLWQIPICVRYPVGKTFARACTLLGQPKGELVLADAHACPDWILANAGEVGYYRALYKGDLLARLLRDGGKMLALPERVGLLGDVSALTENGRLSASEALALVPTLLKEPNPGRHILGFAVDQTASIRELVPAELRPHYERFVRSQFGERAHALGWRPRPGEDAGTRLARPGLLALVADEGQDPELIGQAQKLAQRWLDDRTAIDADLVGVALAVAARHGDRALWERMHTEARKATDRKQRDRLLSALARFLDGALVKKSFALALTDEFDPREAIRVVFGATREPTTRGLAYEFVKQNYDQLARRLPRDTVAALPAVAGGFCDQEHRRDAATFFQDRMTRVSGGPRELAQVLEAISLCAAFRKTQQPAVVAFLKQL